MSLAEEGLPLTTHLPGYWAILMMVWWLSKIVACQCQAIFGHIEVRSGSPISWQCMPPYSQGMWSIAPVSSLRLAGRGCQCLQPGLVYFNVSFSRAVQPQQVRSLPPSSLSIRGDLQWMLLWPCPYCPHSVLACQNNLLTPKTFTDSELR